MKNLTGRPILATLLPPQNHQNQQQQKFNNFSNSHSRSRGVNKISFRTPLLHGNRFFCWLPCSMGMRISAFARPLQRECDNFHFCHTSPARTSKIMKMRFPNHCFGVTSSTAWSANCYKMCILPRHFFFWPNFVLRQNMRMRSKTTHFPNDF